MSVVLMKYPPNGGVKINLIPLKTSVDGSRG
jgi:hypothetical protein